VSMPARQNLAWSLEEPSQVLGTRSYLIVRGRVERVQWIEVPMIPS
jgi:hypothetical protein